MRFVRANIAMMRRSSFWAGDKAWTLAIVTTPKS